MNNKELLLELVRARDEGEVEKIINRNSVLSKDENWRPYDRRYGNFSIIHDQAAHPIPALVEKPINSIDAILIKKCRLSGINPESRKTPASLETAIEQFFRITGADFSEVSESARRSLAENIQIIAEGKRSRPNIIIYDNGEGQHPSDFEDTLVSLSKDNKLKIRFVQGKYHMGSTGVLPYCGTKKFQLIVSRKHPKLLNGKKDEVGFTLVRLHKVTSTDVYKNSWYEYCVDDNGKILSFIADEIDLGLYNTKFKYGTYIKLFNYDLPRPSDITLDLWRDLNRYFYAPGLPILLYEKRGYKGKTPTKLMLGNKMRIMIDERDMKETSFPIQIGTGRVKCPGEVTVFKDSVDKAEFIDKLAVIFSVNGQVHNHLTNAFITNNAKLHYLSGHLLVNINCTYMPTDIREDVFMSSRDRMRESRLYRNFKEEIAKELKDNEYLRRLNEKRRDEKIFRNPKDEEFMKKVLGKLIKKDHALSKILGLEGNIIGEVRKAITKRLQGNGDKPKLRRFPTYVKFRKISPGNIKMVPQNGEGILSIETDAEDEYLIRPRDKGELKIKFEKPALRVGPGKITHPYSADEELFDVNIVGPNQGQIKVRIKAKHNLPVGTEIPVNIEMSSPDGPHQLTAFIKVDNPREKSKEKQLETKETYSLPEIIEVYRESKNGNETVLWSDADYNWGGDDICKIWPSSNEKSLVDAVAVNMDADVLHKYMRERKLKDKNVEHLKRLFKVSTFLISLILYFQIYKKEEIENKTDFTSDLMKGIGKIIIPVTINEEIIKEVEKES